MHVYIVRPHRDNGYYYLSNFSMRNSIPMEIEESKVNDLSYAMLKFHDAQAELARMYHGVSKQEEFIEQYYKDSLSDQPI